MFEDLINISRGNLTTPGFGTMETETDYQSTPTSTSPKSTTLEDELTGPTLKPRAGSANNLQCNFFLFAVNILIMKFTKKSRFIFKALN